MTKFLLFALAVSPLSGATLVGQWQFNNGAALGQDSSGNGYNLTAIGLPAFDASARGGLGAVVLNGTSFFSAAVFPALIPTGNAPVTITAWIENSSPGFNSSAQGIIGWGNYFSQDQVDAFRTASTPGIDHYFWGDDVLSPPFNIFDGTWHFVAMTFAGNTQTVYIDPGQPDAVSASGSGNPNVTGTNFTVGRTCPSCGGSGETFDGELSDVRVYSGALTESELIGIQTPEPSTTMLLGVPALLLLWRRRAHTAGNRSR